MNKLNQTIYHYLKIFLEVIANFLIPKEQKVINLEQLGPGGLFEKIPLAGGFDFETDKIKALFCYKNNLCQQAIWEIKYRANKKLISDFSYLLYEYILDEISDRQIFNNFNNIILLPVPSSRTRLREKGFNQCVLIAKELVKIDQERKQNTFSLKENLLTKNTDTQHQSKTSSRKDRLKNLSNTFQINEKTLTAEKINFTNTCFLIIDDVITTGATMNESFRALRSAGARKIIGFSLAH